MGKKEEEKRKKKRASPPPLSQHWKRRSLEEHGLVGKEERGASKVEWLDKTAVCSVQHVLLRTSCYFDCVVLPFRLVSEILFYARVETRSDDRQDGSPRQYGLQVQHDGQTEFLQIDLETAQQRNVRRESQQGAEDRRRS